MTGIEDAEVGTFSAARFLNAIDRLSKYVIGLLLAGAVLTFPEIVILLIKQQFFATQLNKISSGYVLRGCIGRICSNSTH